MASKTKHRLGDLQLRILKVLWGHDWSSVADVRQRLGRPPLAYTTVATMLRKMEDRQLVAHREEGRKFLYQAAVSAEEVSRSMTDNVVDRLFEGSIAATVNHLLTTREIDADELQQLEALIRDHRRKH
ncbi:MAG: BlaI/MecI/CopY family transcriptional regulator [Planctomycetales bacterium]|nr:BlaI/MecI/CopY family transcriptional regulator [Planctomycetales bacterium]